MHSSLLRASHSGIGADLEIVISLPVVAWTSLVTFGMEFVPAPPSRWTRRPGKRLEKKNREIQSWLLK